MQKYIFKGKEQRAGFYRGIFLLLKNYNDDDGTG